MKAVDKHKPYGARMDNMFGIVELGLGWVRYCINGCTHSPMEAMISVLFLMTPVTLIKAAQNAHKSKCDENSKVEE